MKVKNGPSFDLEHWLTLSGEPASEKAADERQPTLFISSGATDRPLLHVLRTELAGHGIRVVTPEDTITEGSSWPQQCGDTIASADATAFIVSGELRGFAEVELEEALARKKPVIPVVVGSGSLPSHLKEVQGVRIERFGPTGAVSDMLAARVKDAFYPDES